MYIACVKILEVAFKAYTYFCTVYFTKVRSGRLRLLYLLVV
jgi:hypothetical protein